MGHPKDPRPMTAYKCDHCGKWHIGHERIDEVLSEFSSENLKENEEKISA